jgi:hypothetical protein
MTMKSLFSIRLHIIFGLVGWVLFIIFYPCFASETTQATTANTIIQAANFRQTPSSHLSQVGRPFKSDQPAAPAPPSNLRIVSVHKTITNKPGVR